MNLLGAQSLTLPISATSTASASVVLPAKGETVRLMNEGSVTVFVSIGFGAQVATLPNSTPTSTSTPVLSNTDITLAIPFDQVQQISAITTSGSANLYAQVGSGN